MHIYEVPHYVFIIIVIIIIIIIIIIVIIIILTNVLDYASFYYRNVVNSGKT